jgi:hypothetical protein
VAVDIADLGQPEDDLVPQRAEDRSDLVEPLRVLIGDQHAQRRGASLVPRGGCGVSEFVIEWPMFSTQTLTRFRPGALAASSCEQARQFITDDAAWCADSDLDSFSIAFSTTY